jgi:hypothetical protein
MKHPSILAFALTLITSAALLSPTAIYPDEHREKRVAPIRHLPGHEERKREAEAEREAVESGQLAPLSEEAAIQPTPRAPLMSTSFDGMDATVNVSFVAVPPDTHAATGPDHIVEVVNASIAFFNRAGGTAAPTELLSDFFTSIKISDCIFDPVVAYDELAGRFYVGALDVPELCNETPTSTAKLLYAISNSSDPTAGFTHMYAIDVDETSNSGCGLSTPVGGDFTRTGWNADAHVFTFNMFDFPGTCYDHVAVITIDKSTIDTGTLGFTHADRSGSTNFALVPAVMHGSSLGDPMWFLESVFFNQIRVVKMTNVLSSTPSFTETDISVASYGIPPSATQSGGGTFIETNDTRILNAEWRNNRLVATHTVGVSGAARARWYEFNTSTSTPTLTQQGTISPGSGIHTYFPSIAISTDGSLGMTFMQSSSAQFMSMYVTGRLIADPLGTMQTPVLAKAGTRNYVAFDCDEFDEPNVCRAGDYSGITVDPDLPNVFCAANEYATDDSENNWGTRIACFSLGTHDLAVTKLSAPKTAKGNAAVLLPVKVTIRNRSDHNETIPNASFLDDGQTTGLVRLTVDVIDPGSESCADAVVALDTVKNAALFSKGPKILKPKGTATINFLVTYHCSNAKPQDKTDPSPGDYSHTATVYHDVLDGNADTHAADDVCPHDRLPGGHDPNPPSKGTTDNGCGARKSKTAFGNPVVTNVIAP